MGRFSRLETKPAAPPAGSATPAAGDPAALGGPGPLAGSLARPSGRGMQLGQPGGAVPDLQAGYFHYPVAGADEEAGVLDSASCLRQGHEALYRDDFKQALRWYSRALDLESTDLPPWIAVVRTLLLKGDLTEAQTWIGRGLTVFPESPPLLGLRAVSYARRGMLRQAMTNSDAVLERAPNDLESHLSRGEVLLLADSRHAEHGFEQALRLARVDDFHTPMLIGLICEEQRLYARAIAWYGQAAERSARHPAVWYRVGCCRIELGHNPQAQRAFEMAAAYTTGEDPILQKIERVRAGGLWRRLRRLFGLRGPKKVKGV